MLRLLVSTRFQVYFTPRQGCFSPFPLGTVLYRSLNVFSLGPWSARIRTEFHVLRTTWVASKRLIFVIYWAFTVYGSIFQLDSIKNKLCNSLKAPQCLPEAPSTPRSQRLRA